MNRGAAPLCSLGLRLSYETSGRIRPRTLGQLMQRRGASRLNVCSPHDISGGMCGVRCGCCRRVQRRAGLRSTSRPLLIAAAPSEEERGGTRRVSVRLPARTHTESHACTGSTGSTGSLASRDIWQQETSGSKTGRSGATQEAAAWEGVDQNLSTKRKHVQLICQPGRFGRVDGPGRKNVQGRMTNVAAADAEESAARNLQRLTASGHARPEEDRCPICFDLMGIPSQDMQR